MKRIIIAAMLAAFSHTSNGQSREEVVQSKVTDSTSLTSKMQTLEQRLAAQEQETESLKKEHNSLKKQVKQQKNWVTIGGGNKTVVSRKGSKQVITE